MIKVLINLIKWFLTWLSAWLSWISSWLSWLVDWLRRVCGRISWFSGWLIWLIGRLSCLSSWISWLSGWIDEVVETALKWKKENVPFLYIHQSPNSWSSVNTSKYTPYQGVYSYIFIQNPYNSLTYSVNDLLTELLTDPLLERLHKN